MTVHKHLNNISPSSIKWCFDRNWWRETRSCCGMLLLCGSFTIKSQENITKIARRFNKNSKTQCETSLRHSETSIATRDRLRLRKNCSPSKIHLSPVLSQSTGGKSRRPLSGTCHASPRAYPKEVLTSRLTDLESASLNISESRLLAWRPLGEAIYRAWIRPYGSPKARNMAQFEFSNETQSQQMGTDKMILAASCCRWFPDLSSQLMLMACSIYAWSDLSILCSAQLVSFQWC